MNKDRINQYINQILQKTLSSPYFLIFIGVLLIILFLFRLCFIYVEPNEIAIKQVKIGINRGIQDKIYDTGMHIVILVLDFSD